MPWVVGGLAAMVALSAGILGGVDPVACLGRAALAMLLGWFGAQLWYAIFAVRLGTRFEALASAARSEEDGPMLEKD